MKRTHLMILIGLSLLVCTAMLLPGWSAEAPKTPAPKGPPAAPQKVFEDGTPWKAVDQEAAIKKAHETVALVTAVLEETPAQRKARLGDKAPALKDQKHRYLVLDSPILKKEGDPNGDLYAPVRFMHMKHAAVVSDCAECHHRRAAAPDAGETMRCSACHQEAFNAKTPERLGLKAAYHQQCMGCHQERSQGPTDCTGCHAKNVPSHKDLVKLPDNPDPFTVTKECLRCHDAQGEDMLKSAHWLWKGPSPHTEGHEKHIHLGKATNTINNFCIALPSNWPRCTSCHAGYGWKDASFDFSDKTKIDCLICHDTSEKYAKVPTDAGMPYPQINLKEVAESVGKPSRRTCGDCHFQGGGGDAVKHGDMNGILYYPTRDCDVHMGGMDFQCQDCHKTRNHKIAGRSLSVPVAEGSRSCENCHTGQPHKHHAGEGHEGHDLLNHHLNRHTQHIACVTCHSPVYAKCKATKTWWDWSKAGDQERKAKKDEYGMPDYDSNKGEFHWKESAVPTYAWFNGKVRRHVIGDQLLDSTGITRLTEPLGGFTDDRSKIFPFKLMEGRQMADAEHNTLIVPHLFGPEGYWKTFDWDKSFQIGMKSVNLPYSGKFKWVDTAMYWGLNHETMPARNALGCSQCHEALKGDKTCSRCHQDSREVDFKKLSSSGTDFSWMKERGRDVSALIGKTDYIDFKALGYKGDPILTGGRFKRLPLGHRAGAGDTGKEPAGAN